MPLHVAVARGEVLGASTVQIAGDGQRLEEHLRHDHGAAEVQHDTAVIEVRQRARQAFEITMARRADRPPVGGGMLMNDLRADRRVDGDRHAELRAGNQYRHVAPGKILAGPQVLGERLSSAIPKEPSPSPAATSSLVPPYAASSKSWIAALPFIATTVIARFRSSAISNGPRPTLMTCPPSIASTARRPAAAAT